MGDGTQFPVCPFYPESCTVERHASMAHKWRVGEPRSDTGSVAKAVVEAASRPILHVTHKESVTHGVTHAPFPVTHNDDRVTHVVVDVSRFVPGTEQVIQVETRADKQRRWREAHKEEVRAKNRERMREKRAKD